MLRSAKIHKLVCRYSRYYRGKGMVRRSCSPAPSRNLLAAMSSWRSLADSFSSDQTQRATALACQRPPCPRHSKYRGMPSCSWVPLCPGQVCGFEPPESPPPASALPFQNTVWTARHAARPSRGRHIPVDDLRRRYLGRRRLAIRAHRQGNDK